MKTRTRLGTRRWPGPTASMARGCGTSQLSARLLVGLRGLAYGAVHHGADLDANQL